MQKIASQCKLCKHPDRDDLERRIVSKELTMSAAAEKIGCNKSSVGRHMRRHFPLKVAEWVKPEATKEEVLNAINALIKSHDTTLEILEDSLAEGDRRTALMALQTEIKQLELNAKLTGQLNDTPQVNFLLNPEFVRLKQIMIKSLEPFPEARVRLSEALIGIADDDGTN
jgi:hypothetical protein